MLLTFACDISICFGTGILDIFYLLKMLENWSNIRVLVHCIHQNS